jgi:hypothetical protein
MLYPQWKEVVQQLVLGKKVVLIPKYANVRGVNDGEKGWGVSWGIHLFKMFVG